MRNILPYSCLARCLCSCTQGPKHTKFSKAWCPQRLEMPSFGGFHPEWSQELGKGRGLWLLAAELVKVALEVVLAQLRWGKLMWRSFHSYQRSAFPQHGIPSSLEGLQSPRGSILPQTLPFPSTAPLPSSRNRKHATSLLGPRAPGSRAGLTRWKEKLFASGSFSEKAETAAKPPQRGDAAQVSLKNAALQRMGSVPERGHVRGRGQGQPCNTQPSETCS